MHQRQIQSMTSSNKHSTSQLLPSDFVPTDKDVVCGRARENFHHDGNRYFRDIIQRSVGPYLAAQTKLEKGTEIAKIADLVYKNSPNGGFVKKDPSSGRWYRIAEPEARDKCGHAIRKAAQRLEDTKPKAAERLRKQQQTTRLTSGERDEDDGSPTPPPPPVFSRAAISLSASGSSFADDNRKASSASSSQNTKQSAALNVKEDEHLQSLAIQTERQDIAAQRSIGQAVDKQQMIATGLAGSLRTAPQPSFTSPLALATAENRLLQLRNASLNQNLSSTPMEQLLRLQALRTSSTAAPAILGSHAVREQPAVFPQRNSSDSVTANRDVLSHLLAQQRVGLLSSFQQQQPQASIAASSLYDRLLLGNNMLGAGRGTLPTTTSIQDELIRRKAAIQQQIIHESMESKRLKELEYAQRLALSTATHPTNYNNSRFVASRVSGNSQLPTMLQEEESKKPSSTVQVRQQTSQIKKKK